MAPQKILFAGSVTSKEGWFSRGNGKIWVNKAGIYFRRYLSKKVKYIPWEDITEIKEETWHAGKWTGAPVIKIKWSKDGLELISGFSISWKKEETKIWISKLNEVLQENK